jgi:hypothetical protein
VGSQGRVRETVAECEWERLGIWDGNPRIYIYFFCIGSTCQAGLVGLQVWAYYFLIRLP